MDWIFSGIGTAIISFLIGNLSGGAVGYKIGSSKNKQSQKAGDKSTQIQIGNTHNINGHK